MTASAAKRKRSTWIAFSLSVVALIVTGVLGAFAVTSLADSTVGRDVTRSRAPSVTRLPWTATALIGVVDEDGRLATSVVAVLQPSGRGGVIVDVSPSADVAGGRSELIRPLATILAVDGPEAWRSAMEQITGLSFDVAEVVDRERFGRLISPLGDLPVVFPFDMLDANSRQMFEAGGETVTTEEAGRAITARNEDGPAWVFDPGRNAVWASIADRVGAGIGSLPDGVQYDVTFRPPGLDSFVDALFAAPVDFRALSEASVDPVVVQAALPPEYQAVLGEWWADSVVAHDRGEVALVFASIAPARRGAPLDGPTARIVSGFSDDDAASVGMNRSDLMIAAIHAVLATDTNVVSVVDMPGAGVPDHTRVQVGDERDIEVVWSLLGDTFGDMQVVVVDQPIQGVGMEIFLGRDYLDLATRAPASTETAEAPPTTDALAPGTTDVAGSDS